MSTVVALAIALLTIGIWSTQRERDNQQIARIAEAESYAARSQLIRNIELLIDALRNARQYWATYGHQPRDQWASDAGVELSHFDGMKIIIWDDPARGNRYVRTPENAGFDYRPGDEEWHNYQAMVQRLREQDASTMVGPFVGDSGDAMIEIRILDDYSPGSGRVAALVDAPVALASFLQDESPGYALAVSWDGETLFKRGEAAPGTPPSWTRSGMIETSLGPLWKVQHSPTDSLRESFGWRTGNLSLMLGLAIALLVGSLTFESGRSRARAAEAESAEQRLAELNRDLETEIDKRTSTLAARTTVLQTITDSVSHDLRNPLNSISMNANLLQRQVRDPEADESKVIFERISRGIQQMIDILDRLLGLSSATHSAFDPVPLDMRELVQDVYDEIADNEPPPPVEFEISALPDAVADRRLVRMLVLNLLSNALKYTRDRDPRRISVGYQRVDGVVTYSIEDNGIGFDAVHAEKMFAAFHRLDNSKGADGHGLGLAIVASVVSRHGGRIWANSAPGEGATFCFTLMPPPA